MTDPFHEVGKMIGVINSLGLEEQSTSSHFCLQPGDFAVEIIGTRVDHRADVECGALIERVVHEICARIEFSRSANQLFGG